MQQRQRKRRRLLYVIVPVVALVLLISVSLSTGFKLRRVDVSGNKHLSDSEIKELAEVPAGVSVIRLPTATVTGNLRKSPWIKNATVNRRFLSRTALIDIEERKPLFVAPSGDAFVLVDNEGVVLESRTDSEVPYPLLQDLPAKPPKPGAAISSKSFANALACVKNLDAKLRQSVNIVSAPSVRGLTLWTRGGVEILYGQAEDVEKKNFVIKKFLGEPGKVVFIDVSVVSNPTVRRLEEDTSDDSTEKSSD